MHLYCSGSKHGLKLKCWCMMYKSHCGKIRFSLLTAHQRQHQLLSPKTLVCHCLSKLTSSFASALCMAPFFKHEMFVFEQIWVCRVLEPLSVHLFTLCEFSWHYPAVFSHGITLTFSRHYILGSGRKSSLKCQEQLIWKFAFSHAAPPLQTSVHVWKQHKRHFTFSLQILTMIEELQINSI